MGKMATEFTELVSTGAKSSKVVELLASVASTPEAASSAEAVESSVPSGAGMEC